MSEPQQLSLFSNDQKEPHKEPLNSLYSGRELGTFKDSLRAPIHRWFKYPAGYSYKFIYESLDIFGIDANDWVYDPFSGTGTTLIAAKVKGVNGYGVEAHSFVHWVARTKLYWEFDYSELGLGIRKFLADAQRTVSDQIDKTSTDDVFPELIYKCFHPDDLKVLLILRELVNQETDLHFQNLLKLALTDTLRGSSTAGTGWPYISPKKDPTKEKPKVAFNVFKATLNQMYLDLMVVSGKSHNSQILNILGDSRQRQFLLDNEQIDLALTSPPYLNNYDYADRTRLETYFWGITSTWGEITEMYRNKLMVAATTQITRSEHVVEEALSDELRQCSPTVYTKLQMAVLQLADLRLQKGGRKDYDLMTALYFNDIFDVLTETFRVLKRGGYFCLVLGDSAPYGVHVPTDDYIGQIALDLGFSEYTYHKLRIRGGKWKDNPQRHTVKLREGIVVLRK